MEQTQHKAIVSFIWSSADDILRDIIGRGKYRDVVLPMTVIRRLDSLLEETKEEVLEAKQKLDQAGVANQYAALCNVSGQAFYNISPFTLKRLLDNPNQLRANFEAYLDGFSQNVQEILDKFDFRKQIPRLVEADILYQVIEKFVDPLINLGPYPTYDGDKIKLPGLDNHGMGTVFEELIRRFNEENNEEAGEHFTPRDVVQLMADIIFLPVADQVQSGTYLVYDGACGTGGMLTVAEERLLKLAKQHNREVSIHLFGQETNAEIYAICKADLMLKGEGEGAENIEYGSTLSADAFPSLKFDFMLSNPPYGKSWGKTDLQRMGGKAGIRDSRYIVEHAGDPEFSLLPRVSDGQMLFLVNMLSKMKTDTSLGSRIAEVHNGSALFTGDAGQGESNIRRWIIENDWLEAIVALPENMFYNTGIPTYIWVLSNCKSKYRKGKIQLIDATQWYHPLRKNLGKKNCKLAPDHIKMICESYLRFKDDEHSKIFPNAAFGYRKITVQRPLRLSIDLSDERKSSFRKKCEEIKEISLAGIVDQLAAKIGVGPHKDFNVFYEAIQAHAKAHRTRLTANGLKLLREELAYRDENAEPVFRKREKRNSGTAAQETRYGRYLIESQDTAWIVEYESDPELRDIERVPLLEKGGVKAFFEREVLPYVPDAWIDASKDAVGYEISFTKYFYTPRPLRALEEIKSDIFALELEAQGLLKEVLGEELRDE